VKEETVLKKRSMVISLVSIIAVFLGIVGTLSAIMLSVILSMPIDVSTSFRDHGVFLSILWFVAGPLLILAGYNLWKMKKWAAQLTATIILFDLVTSPFVNSFIFTIPIGAGDVLAWVIDIIILALIASAWNKFT